MACLLPFVHHGCVPWPDWTGTWEGGRCRARSCRARAWQPQLTGHPARRSSLMFVNIPRQGPLKALLKAPRSLRVPLGPRLPQTLRTKQTRACRTQATPIVRHSSAYDDVLRACNLHASPAPCPVATREFVKIGGPEYRPPPNSRIPLS